MHQIKEQSAFVQMYIDTQIKCKIKWAMFSSLNCLGENNALRKEKKIS